MFKFIHYVAQAVSIGDWRAGPGSPCMVGRGGGGPGAAQGPPPPEQTNRHD